MRKPGFLSWRPFSSIQQPLFEIYESCRTTVLWTQQHHVHDPVREQLLRGKKVLIVGSGPSAAELERISSGLTVLTCKFGLKLFEQRNFSGPVDLFMCWKGFVERNLEVLRLLSKVKTRVLVMDDLPFTRSIKLPEDSYCSLIPDDGKDNFYLKRLIKPYSLKSFKPGKDAMLVRGKVLQHVSSGLRLLQYALYFGAEEIYLIGIDLTDEGYFWGQPKKQKHLAIDNFFMRIVSEKYRNVFSLSKKSAITRYIPYKPLEG